MARINTVQSAGLVEMMWLGLVSQALCQAQQAQGSDSSSLPQWDHTWHTGSSLELPSMRKALPHWRESNGGVTTIGRAASHEGQGDVGKLLAIVKTGNNGSLLLSSVIYLEETQRQDTDFSQRCTWQNKAWLTEAAMCEIFK